MRKIYSAESVSIAHPDKIADQISDAILDAFLAGDPKAHVAVETTVTQERIILAGEITSSTVIDYEKIVRQVVGEIYAGSTMGLDLNKLQIQNFISGQSKDIAQAVERGGAGDQGIMIGYATDETDCMMPMPVVLANTLMEFLRLMREKNEITYLGPDAKCLVEIAYEGIQPMKIHTIILSTQHEEGVSPHYLRQDLKPRIEKLLPKELFTNELNLLINPADRFVIGGTKSDTGVTGRKQMVDAYGVCVRQGGGAFSGKDPTKVDRSGAYLARYIAKNIVKTALAKRCEVMLTYAIGKPLPVTLQIDTLGTSEIPDTVFETIVPKVFALDVRGLIKMLDLERPIYLKTAYGGHFGRSDPDFTWERTDKIQEIVKACHELR